MINQDIVRQYISRMRVGAGKKIHAWDDRYPKVNPDNASHEFISWIFFSDPSKLDSKLVSDVYDRDIERRGHAVGIDVFNLGDNAEFKRERLLYDAGLDIVKRAEDSA